MLEVAQAFRELTQCHRIPDEAGRSRRAPWPPPSALAGWAARPRRTSWRATACHGLVAKVKELGADQAVVITRPHAVADTFHTDWANKAQDKLGLPVLHLYAGSGFIGDS